MKDALADGGVARQALLIPEVVELDPAEAERVARTRATSWRELGLVLEPFGPARCWCARRRRCSARSTSRGLVRDLADELAEYGERAGAEGAAGGGLRHHGLPRLGARRAAA